MLDERLRETDWTETNRIHNKRTIRKAKEQAIRRRSERGRFVRAVEPIVRQVGEVFATSDGTLAYVKRMPNIVALGNYFKTDKATHTNVSLPWVSLLAKPLEKLRPTHEQA